MKKENKDFSKLKVLDVGEDDFFTAVNKNVDMMWIFEGWTGIEAKQRGMELNASDIYSLARYFWLSIAKFSSISGACLTNIFAASFGFLTA